MDDRSILRFPSPTRSRRRIGSQRSLPRPRGPGRVTQGRRFQATFDRLTAAFENVDPALALRQDPVGIAPERALVFVTAGRINQFARVAQKVGLEVFTESSLEELEEFPDGFEPAGEAITLDRTLYATMPTLESFQQILSLWNAHQREEKAPDGDAPWWSVFDLLLELRPWGPEDRLNEDARAVIKERLALNEGEEFPIEFEIWPTANFDQRTRWRQEVERHIENVGGSILDRSSISENGFDYEAILASLPTQAVRAMLDNPGEFNGLTTLHGVQLILPQTIGQAEPFEPTSSGDDYDISTGFVDEAPIRVALFDGTPTAGHPVLNGGVVIEDIHDLVYLSLVNQRHHATAMASLILRGDLEVDGKALQDTRLISVPILTDTEQGSWAPDNRLFVDLLYTSLIRLLTANEPLAPDVFVVNFSIGVNDTRFAGRVSSLARLMDWWAAKEGVLFVISAGNVGGLLLAGVTSVAFEDAEEDERRNIVWDARRVSSHDRTLMAPAEALNGLTIGALSMDLNGHSPPEQAGILSIESNLNTLPQISSAVGLGPHRAIKPDLLNVGGRQEVRVNPDGRNVYLDPLRESQRTGLIVAATNGGRHTTQKLRGTSPAAALTTRSILQSAESLTGQGGPYEGQELPRKTLALLTRALAVNSARWPDDASGLYKEELSQLGRYHHMRAKEEVCRYFGYGIISPELMQHSPDNGVTLVGLGSIRKDQALIFRMPLPPSMSGERLPRSMRVTLAWFTPVNPARAQYRLAGLEAVAAEEFDEDEDKGWKLDLKTNGPDSNMVKRGSVWSRRLIHDKQTVPNFNEGDDIPICVQCRDTSGGGLSADDDIDFAIAVTLEIEANVQFDIYDEINQEIRIRLR